MAIKDILSNPAFIHLLVPQTNLLRPQKGHYVVVRCSSRQEAERWRKALETHTVEDFASQYVQPHPHPTNPTLLRDTLIIDLGSCSVRAGVLAAQATLPLVFFPTVLATDRETRRHIWGAEALTPETRSTSTVTFPLRPTHRISKVSTDSFEYTLENFGISMGDIFVFLVSEPNTNYKIYMLLKCFIIGFFQYSVDLDSLTSLLMKTFSDLKVDPKNYNLQISIPRVFSQHTQSELLRILFEK